MGNTQKCMEQAVLLCYVGGGNHAGDQGGRVIEDFPG